MQNQSKPKSLKWKPLYKVMCIQYKTVLNTQGLSTNTDLWQKVLVFYSDKSVLSSPLTEVQFN